MRESVSCGCNMCGRTITSPLESTMESFRRTLTLERTLGMLSSGSSVSSFDTKTLLNVMTSEEGSVICFKCSSILHTGLQVMSQILLLESRLRNLGAKIRTTEVTENFSSHRLLVRKIHRQVATSDFSSKLLSSSTKGSSSSEVIGSSDNKKATRNQDAPAEKETSKSSSESEVTIRVNAAALHPRREFPHGVLRCPCSFSVDVRSPSQVTSPKLLSKSARESLRKQSQRQLIEHFTHSHMPSSSEDNFKRNNSGAKIYFCSVSTCDYTNPRYTHLVSHFMNNHFSQSQTPIKLDPEPTAYSCPESNCSFTVEVSQTPRRPKINNPQRVAKDTLAAHVFRTHDKPPKPPKKKTPKWKMEKPSTLFSVVGSGCNQKKVYRCSRCDYERLLPNVVSRSHGTVIRNDFLRHFYDTHLTT